MAADPKTPTPTQPDQKFIPVRSITFTPGLNLTIPGKDVTTNSVTASVEPVRGRYWTIGFDPRLRSFRVACFDPGEALDRPPSRISMVMESVVCTWVPA